MQTALAQNPYRYGNCLTQLHLNLWYDADTGVTTSGSDVTAWANKDSNWYNLYNLNGTGSCGSSRPTLVSDALNGYPALQFANNQHLMCYPVASQNFKNLNQIALYAVLQSTKNGIVFHHSKGGYALHYATDHSRWGGVNNYSFLTFSTPVSTPYEIRTFIVSFNIPTSQSVYKDYTNGKLTTSRTYQSSYYLSSVTDTLLLGNRWVNSCNDYSFEGRLAEIMVYKDNHYWNAPQRAKVTSLLSLKYGISQDNSSGNLSYLNSDSIDLWPYATTTSGIQFENYKTRITGMFRDKCFMSSSHTKSSNQSADVVSMALTDNGGTFSSPNEFNKDKQALLWGDNNGDLTFNETTDVPASFTRLARTWKVKETLNGGTIGNVTIEFDFSTIPSFSISANKNNILCLVDTDGDGSFADETGIVPTTWDNGTEIGQFTADFDDGQMFSFAIKTTALPVTWLSHKAMANLQNIDVEWSCATETNNDYFGIEKLNEFGDWIEIGRQTGAGNSLRSTHYKFIDASPLNGINYYRIGQVDFDGTNSYSLVFSAQCLNCPQDKFNLLTANPNSDGWLSLEIGPSSMATQISLFNKLGVQVYHHSVFEGKHELNLGYLPSGMYTVTIRQGSYFESKRIVFE